MVAEYTPRENPRFPAVHDDGPFRLVNTDGTALPPLRSLLEGPYRLEVRRAVDRLYQAFSAARLSEDFTGCPHCFTLSDIEYVRRTPVAAFTHDELAVISFHLVTTLGKGDDVPYFIPRLIEAFAEGMAIDIEPLADRIARVPAAWWTAERSTALRSAFDVLFDVGPKDHGGLFDDPEARDCTHQTRGVAERNGRLMPDVTDCINIPQIHMVGLGGVRHTT
jgi:hypothetical protein